RVSTRGAERQRLGTAEPGPPGRTSGQRQIDVSNCAGRRRVADRGVALRLGRARHSHGHGGQTGRGARLEARESIVSQTAGWAGVISRVMLNATNSPVEFRG